MITKEELLGRARELAPVFGRRALDEEMQRTISSDTVRDLRDSEILRTLTPKVYGGLELGLDAMTDITRIIAAACPSTGWITAFYIGASWRSLFYSEAGQREVFGDSDHVLMAGTAAPLTDVRRVDGGYIANGQTAWSFGCVHADWISFTGLVKEEAGPPSHMTFIVRKEEIEVIDNWFVAGMRGTASNDVKVTEVFIPNHRAASFSDTANGPTAGQLLHANPMYHLPFLPFAMAEVVPVVVGATRGCADAFLDRTRTRQGALSGIKASGKQSAHIRLGKSIAATAAAETLLDVMIDRMARPLDIQTQLDERIRIKVGAAHIVDQCRNAINEMARGFGADGFRDVSPLQRYFRDVNMLATHGFMDFDAASEAAGRHALGLPREDPLI